MLAGIPAAALGAAMLRGVKKGALQPLFITAGVLLAGVLLVLMTGLDLLVKVGYLPAAIFGLFTAEKDQDYLQAWSQWTTIHQLLCMVGGFLWLAGTVCYARRSVGACVYCGRRDGAEGWTGPERAVRWGRIALYVAMVAPIFYAFTRYAWALGIPLGMSEAHLRQGQASGTWISGTLLGNLRPGGTVLMLGLVQRWGENFPRWMIGLAGRRVPIAGGGPASLAAVLLVVGGVGIWAGLSQMVAMRRRWASDRTRSGKSLPARSHSAVPGLGRALAVATLGYYPGGAVRAVCAVAANYPNPLTTSRKVLSGWAQNRARDRLVKGQTSRSNMPEIVAQLANRRQLP